MGLDVGDQVRSNETGFGELGYFEGSWMRIEARATLTIEELADTEEGQAVETSVDGGRLWSRTEKLTDSGDRFEVDTPVASASVRGTRFAIDCTVDWGEYAALRGVATDEPPPEESCSFTVIEGTVTVTLPNGEEYVLGPAQQLIVADDGRDPIGPVQLVPDELYANDWISKNLGVDLEEPGAEEELTEEAKEANLSAATLAKEWEADVTITSSTDPRYPAGSRDVGGWLVSVECAGGSCNSQRQVVGSDGQPALRDGAGAPVVDQVVGTGSGGYEFHATWTEPCGPDGSVLAADGIVTERVGRYTVTELEFREGRWVATVLEGTVDATTTLTAAGQAAGCALPDNAASVGFTSTVVARAVS
jgi:hypothetical protein